MRLHENPKLFQQAIRATAQQKGLPEIYIEKDYWVTFALCAIFNDPIGSETVFKGGTALSKCFNIIERFSEDIDLIVLRHIGETNNQLTSKIKKISKVVSQVLPEVQVEGLTHKMGMNRKTGHTYRKEFQGEYGQVRDIVVVEATWLGYHEPYQHKKINSFIFDMMVQTGQETIAEEYGLLPFEVLVLAPKRTLCEKIMSLVRFSYSVDPINELGLKIRHTYDIHKLIQNNDLKKFLFSLEFDQLLLKVAQDDVISYKNNNKWLEFHPNESIIFSNPKDIWVELEKVYFGNFKNLVYGKLPDSNMILESLNIISDRLSTIKWEIDI